MILGARYWQVTMNRSIWRFKWLDKANINWIIVMKIYDIVTYLIKKIKILN